MVILCKNVFEEQQYNDHFETFPFELSDFQKYSIKALVEGQHALITAHTGSGKTLPAEFAIEYFHKLGKKCIYTSPIKALSNQKFYEFTKKFPHIDFGILTGDIKYNPNADVLIMTTEILRNTLLHKKVDSNNNQILDFDMDFENDLACVVFDEIHYINDEDRGKIWEESIMLMPQHVQLLMLSATIDNPEKFASWIETTKNNSKEVYLAVTDHRVVPLEHYCYISLPQGPLKMIKDKEFRQSLEKIMRAPVLIKNKEKLFYDDNYKQIKKYIDYNQKNYIRISPSFVINNLLTYLRDNNMLPAICFIFSRKNVEKYASMVNVNLLDYDSEVPANISHTCDSILRKLPNHEEYRKLPEYHNIVALLQKGIAIHHSGILPIFREMIEMIFGMGHVKVLFATETFAVGINMPTKSVIFSNFEKFNGSGMRMLLPHEYTQMAGRAGRRGLDKIGYVIHCNNLFSMPDSQSYKNLMNGPPQRLVSKFKTSYNLILQLCKKEDQEFTSKSMIKNDILSQINQLKEQIKIIEDELIKKQTCPNYDIYLKYKDNILEYSELKNAISSLKQKKRKDAERKLKTMEEDKNFKQYITYHDELVTMEKNKRIYHDQINYYTQYFKIQMENVSHLLSKHGFLNNENDLSNKGKNAIHIQEANCLSFADILEDNNYFQDMEPAEIVAFMSCFTNIRVSDDEKTHSCEFLDIPYSLKQNVNLMKRLYEKYQNEENYYRVESGEKYDFHLDLIEETYNWCGVSNEIECKELIQNMQENKNVFLGEFIKSLLKINNLTNECITIANENNEVEFLHKLSQIPNLILKFVATTQSLYI